MRKEYGNKMMMISLSYQFALAWVVAFIVTIVGNLIVSGSTSIEYIIGGAIVLIAAFILFKMFTKKSSGCSSCSSCPSSGSCHVKATNE